jgi:hypothetical protein
MGLFKQLKGTKEDVLAGIRDAQTLGTQTQRQTDAALAGAHAGDYEPIAGVSLELYTAIAKGVAAVGYDQARGPEVAATHGVSTDSWKAAVAGWNARIKASPEVAGRFNALYTGRA